MYKQHAHIIFHLMVVQHSHTYTHHDTPARYKHCHSYVQLARHLQIACSHIASHGRSRRGPWACGPSPPSSWAVPPSSDRESTCNTTTSQLPSPAGRREGRREERSVHDENDLEMEIFNGCFKILQLYVQLCSRNIIIKCFLLQIANCKTTHYIYSKLYCDHMHGLVIVTDVNG